jgi:hypothetical protein
MLVSQCPEYQNDNLRSRIGAGRFLSYFDPAKLVSNNWIVRPAIQRGYKLRTSWGSWRTVWIRVLPFLQQIFGLLE